MRENASSEEEVFFEVETPLGFRVRTIVNYWEIVRTVKHPIMQGREEDVKETLRHSDEVRLSKSDSQVYLFYRGDGQK